jgi:hypothetical protein
MQTTPTARPVKPDMAAKEAAVISTLLAEWPDELPPYCARILKNAPESLDDLRLANIAVAIRQLREAGKPVAPLTVREQLNSRLDDAGGVLFVESLAGQAIGIGIAEYEAADLWANYRTRRLKSVYADAGAAMEADPNKADAIVAGVRRALDELQDDVAARPGELLKLRKYNPAIIPPPLRPIYTLAGIPISTPANLATITSAVKTGKSAVIGAMAAAPMSHREDADLLGFGSSNPKDMALLWFDSEQSPDDFWHCVYRALKRAGLQNPPPWLHAYCLTGLGYRRAWECVTEATKAAADLHGGIHSTLIDGFADLVADVNDPGESNAFVAELHDMAIQLDCPIIGVIHFNPGGEKSRGHLGSQVERKAETNLALEKDTDETTVIYSTKNRRAGIPKHLGPRFAFNPEAGMHVTVASRQSVKDAERREALLSLAEDVFADRPAMRYSDIKSTVMTVARCKDRQAEKKVAAMKRLTVIKTSVAGLYEIATPA